MAKHSQQEIVTLKNHFLKHKKKVLLSLTIAAISFGLAAACAGLKLLYPFHFIVSVVFLLIALRYLIKAFLFDRQKVSKSKIFRKTKNIIFQYKLVIAIVLVVLFCVYIAWTVIPYSGNPFEALSVEERHELIENDVEIATVLLDNLELAADDLIQDPILKKSVLTADDRIQLQNKWNLFLSVAMESEKNTDIHKYFNRISVFSHPKDHAQSFGIAYSLYIKKFEIFHKLIDTVDDNNVVIKQLNEYSPVFGAKDSYDDVLDRFFSSDSFVRRNMGRFYISLLNLTLSEKNLNEGYIVLTEEAEKSYAYLLSNIFNTTVKAAKEQRYSLEKELSNLWFPVQKNVANMMGDSYLSSRHEKFITLEQIAELKKEMQPGDIMVQRRNWYASNVGIPGFWAHAALYVGTLEDMNAHFADLFPMGEYQNVEQLLAQEHPKLLKQLKEVDKDNFKYSVIEGKSPGIILQSLEQSARADYLGVLRPRLSKKDTFDSVMRAFENYGKPYDYNFDFETRDELVCSELVYDAYQPIGTKKGLHFELRMTSGRKIISPTDMVKKYSAERGTENRELDFVYFIDGNEELEKAFVKTEEEFAQSFDRPKYSWFQK
ncbi:MAG: YiiX/YebB-like N1pC/P60 family cysteine hydrolase [Patescibacteria group bacterium]